MIKSIVKWLVFKCIYPCCYRLTSRKHVNRNKIIFVENHQDYLTDNFKLLYQELKKRGFELHVHYLKVASSGWKDIILRSSALLRDMGDASCVFLNESNSLFGAFKLRKETKLIQIWHACGAFKKWGYSAAGKSFGEDEKNLDRYSGHRNYTLVPVSGKEVCWAYEEAFGLAPEDGIVKPLGVNRTDVFFDNEFLSKAREHLKKEVPWLNGRKVILYAPTFRGDIRNAQAPDKLKLEQFYDYLQKDYILLIKQHPFIKEHCVIEEKYTAFCKEIKHEMTMEELIAVADICITDYSSVIFDFSLMQRPILFFAYDLEDYYDERGFYYPYETFVPGPVLRNSQDLISCIRRIDEFDYTEIKAFRQRFMSGCDGHSTERILNEIL